MREALKRREIFDNLDKYLCRIHKLLVKLDPFIKDYLFGSVAENRYVYSSDIDILVVTNLKPGQVISYLWKNGIEDPFEIHVITQELLLLYENRGKLISLEEYCRDTRLNNKSLDKQ